MFNLNEQQIIDNFRLFIKEIENLKDKKKSDAILEFIQLIDERLAFAPASTRTNFHGCFIGGLIWHTLSMLKTVREIEKTFISLGGKKEWTDDQLTIACLFHDLGKMGDMQNDYYIQTTTKWQNEKGIYYEVNKDIYFSTVPERSLYLLQSNNITLTHNEYYGIKLSDGPFDDNIKQYFSNFVSSKNFPMSILVHQGDWMSCLLEKN